ncbi:MAG: type II toxin-antitoxin system VapB family antitoxin [Deferrisomatales bacterium]|nr:type II toxin-antitoxin system VapB family antitoxin [Deferrisomatales bacterium]
MAMSIRNPTAERLAREVAARTGETMTDAVIHALEERLERLAGTGRSDNEVQEILAIARRCAALPDLDTRSADEILGYDEDGVPGRW